MLRIPVGHVFMGSRGGGSFSHEVVSFYMFFAVTWKDAVASHAVLSGGNIRFLFTFVLRCNLQWIDQENRMEGDRMLNDILCGADHYWRL